MHTVYMLLYVCTNRKEEKRPHSDATHFLDLDSFAFLGIVIRQRTVGFCEINIHTTRCGCELVCNGAGIRTVVRGDGTTVMRTHERDPHGWQRDDKSEDTPQCHISDIQLGVPVCNMYRKTAIVVCTGQSLCECDTPETHGRPLPVTQTQHCGGLHREQHNDGQGKRCKDADAVRLVIPMGV